MTPHNHATLLIDAMQIDSRHVKLHTESDMDMIVCGGILRYN